MNKYTIADLEQLTGIKAHTLRIWEKRYNIVKPHRTKTHIRYYDNHQLRKLLNIATLLARGYKISQVVALNKKEIEQKIETLEQLTEDKIYLSYIHNLTMAIIEFDELAFEKIFSAAIVHLGMYDTIVKVIYPFLHKTGLLWRINKLLPVQEHFASAIIKRKLASAIDGLPTKYKSDKKYILFLPPDEYHEIGLLFADYILRKNGSTTIYLGQNVPYENLENIISSINPQYLLTFYTTRKNITTVQSFLKKILLKYKHIHILVSGCKETIQQLNFSSRIKLLYTPDVLAEYI